MSAFIWLYSGLKAGVNASRSSVSGIDKGLVVKAKGAESAAMVSVFFNSLSYLI